MTTGGSYYYWEGNNPVNVDRDGTQTCFVTGENISCNTTAYWTSEFDSWISERGYQMIQNAYSTGELENNKEWEIIFAEWYPKDESVSGRQKDWSEWDNAGLYTDDNF